MCIRGGKQPCDWDDSNFKSKQKAGWLTGLADWLTVGFDGAACLKWFSGDGSSVWCQWDRGGTQGEGVGGMMATVQDLRSTGWEEQRIDMWKEGEGKKERQNVKKDWKGWEVEELRYRDKEEEEIKEKPGDDQEKGERQEDRTLKQKKERLTQRKRETRKA
ncbi:putative cyclin-dependent serine/threonine-protein kinase [Dissostichus eleginoides]|uniref:Cyclin-dependent serine/threonine-protein kinase n=1 Tax=Dissostichus eleginoides TaxID=100907 RepID=A0AAD9CEA7_DISEL|nr:putative cyclin-dependent serine/threonine-protein kinase [Dissostichus eleginoides]